MKSKLKRHHALLLCHIYFVNAYIRVPCCRLDRYFRSSSLRSQSSNPRDDQDHHEAGGTPLTTSSISYSPNFQRHIVRSRDGTILKSYTWLEDAVEAFPSARLLPLVAVADHGMNESAHDDEAAKGCIPGTIPSCMYYNASVLLDHEDNVMRISNHLQTTLGLNPQQIERALSCVNCIPFAVLEERLRFLLAPLPTHLVNATGRLADVIDETDWPLELERNDYGAGLSAEQVAIAMETLPELVLLPFGMQRLTLLEMSSLLGFLYQKTPTIVLDMARKQLDPFVAGASNVDFLACAFLHWQGWGWTNCRAIFRALPSVLTVDLETGWELRNIKKKVRERLRGDAVKYLQWRLQLRPWQIHALVRTHPALSGYTKKLLETKVELLQSLLESRSSVIQRLVFAQPSLLGMSSDALESRVLFWSKKIGLSTVQIEATIKRLPALLQYSVPDNLELKHNFFCQKLEIDEDGLRKMTVTRPAIWGRSLKHHFEPFVEAFCERLAIDEPELGRIIAKAPELLLCSWRGNLCIKIDFLQSRLNLQDFELRRMITKSPKILMQGMQTSLEQKINLLEATALEMGVLEECRLAVVNNPSLLQSTSRYLRARISNLPAPGSSDSARAASGILLQVLGRPSKSDRRLRLVQAGDKASDIQSVERVFENVAEAADFCSMSRSNMYRVIRKGLEVIVDGQRYRLETSNSHTQAQSQAASAASPLIDVVEDKKSLSASTLSTRGSKVTVVISTTGRAFPTERYIRGRRRGGGMAMHIELGQTGTDGLFWQKILNSLYEGQPFKAVGNTEYVLILLGYAYTRPTRQRCSLYVVREALRLAREWVRQTPGLHHEVVVRTNSCSYVANLLQEERLAGWSMAQDLRSFTEAYDGPTEHVYQANPDILHPLSRTYRHLMKSNVTVKFEAHANMGRLSEGALRAARHMYEVM